MSHQNLFLIVPPRPRRPRRRRTYSHPLDRFDALLSSLLPVFGVHAFLALISWCVFLYAPFAGRVVIVLLWAGYIALVTWFVRSISAGASRRGYYERLRPPTP